MLAKADVCVPAPVAAALGVFKSPTSDHALPFHFSVLTTKYVSEAGLPSCQPAHIPSVDVPPDAQVPAAYPTYFITPDDGSAL